MKETPKLTVDLTDVKKELAKLARLHADKVTEANRMAQSDDTPFSEVIKYQFDELCHSGFVQGIIEAMKLL